MDVLKLPHYALADVINTAIGYSPVPVTFLSGKDASICEKGASFFKVETRKLTGQLKFVDPNKIIRKVKLFMDNDLNRQTVKAFFFGFNATEVQSLIMSTSFFRTSNAERKHIAIVHSNTIDDVTKLINALRKLNTVQANSLACLLDKYLKAVEAHQLYF